MTEKQPLSAIEALENLFNVVREEAASNSQFAYRLLDAIGTPVLFQGDDALKALDPIMIADLGLEEFRQTFLTFPAKDLKKIMKDFGLATISDFKGKTRPPQLVDLMWERASNKLYELKPGLQRAS